MARPYPDLLQSWELRAVEAGARTWPKRRSSVWVAPPPGTYTGPARTLRKTADVAELLNVRPDLRPYG